MSVVDSLLVPDPVTPAQKRTYAARLARARAKYSSAAPDLAALDTELKALRAIASALTSVPPEARARVLEAVGRWLSGA